MMDYDIRNGHTYMYSKAEPLYPFGYGLSYTTFGYSDMKTGVRDGEVCVSFTLTNTGATDGDEVPQLYMRVAPGEPYKLRSFARVAVPAGESRRVELRLRLDEAGDWRPAERDFRLPKGAKVDVAVGASSADLRLHGQVKAK